MHMDFLICQSENEFENYTFEITSTSLREQYVNEVTSRNHGSEHSVTALDKRSSV